MKIWKHKLKDYVTESFPFRNAANIANGTGTAFPSSVLDFIPGFCWDSFCSFLVFFFSVYCFLCFFFIFCLPCVCFSISINNFFIKFFLLCLRKHPSHVFFLPYVFKKTEFGNIQSSVELRWFRFRLRKTYCVDVS